MIDFRQYLTMTPTYKPNPKLAYAPINLVFFRNALLDNVVSILKDPALNIWRPDLPTTSPVIQPTSAWYEYDDWLRPTPEFWCELDNSAARGWKGTKPADRELFIGSDDVGYRMHIQLYAPTDPFTPTSSALPDGTFGYWCIASIHREFWSSPSSHTVNGWMEARAFAADWFSRLADGPFSEVISVTDIPLQNDGWYQGYGHDGKAAFIQIGGRPGTILRP